MNFFKKIIKNQKGITLLELMVAVSIFSVMILAVTQIFQMVLEAQRNAIAAQNLQESMRYAMEVMTKEVRMAQEVETGECASFSMDNQVYKTDTGAKLYFKNYNDICVEYKLNGTRFEIIRDGTAGFITPDEISVSNLEFIVANRTLNQQARVTMKMDIEAEGKEINKQKMTIQTTISSRYYE